MRINKLIYTTYMVGLSLLCCSHAVAVQEKNIYLGGGMGLSMLEPETDNTPFELSDDGDLALQLYLGYRLNRDWAFELSYADLGTAELQPEAEISYQTYSGHALYFLPLNLPESWSLYAKAGLTRLDNEAKNLQIEQVESHQFHFGGGVEYQWTDHFAVRFDVSWFDEDAALIALNVHKYFTKSNKKPATVEPILVEEKPAIVETPIESEAGPEIINTELFDDDNDGVLNRDDLCPDTRPKVTVDTNGCQWFAEYLQGVHFVSGRAEFVQGATVKLDKVAALFASYPSLQVEIQAYTDSRGAKQDNQRLSEARANHVMQYLVGKGVDQSRLKTKGYGESRAIACNDTQQGRAENRRVEFEAIGALASQPVLAYKQGMAVFSGPLNGIEFTSTSDEITDPSSLRALAEVVNVLQQDKSLRVEIQGHTDHCGDESYNLRLSQARADQVKRYLVSEGIAADRLVAKGYGESRPLIDNSTAKRRADNKRIELKLIESQLPR